MRSRRARADGPEGAPPERSGGRWRTRLLAYAADAGAACAWGTWAIVVRHADALAPGTPVALQSTIVMAVVTLVSGAAAFFDRVPGRASGRARLWVVCSGVADAFNVFLFFAAYKHTIAVAVLTHYLTPIFVALAAPLVLGERLTPTGVVAIVASFLGLAVLLLPSVGGAGASAIWTSALLGAGSAGFYAANVIINKLVTRELSTSEMMFWHGTVATPLLALFVPMDAWHHVADNAFLAVVAIGPGALAGLAFVWGLRRIPAAHASTLTLLEPLVSIVLGAAVLGERIGAGAGLGGVLILGGALLVMTQPQVKPGGPQTGSTSTVGK